MQSAPCTVLDWNLEVKRYINNAEKFNGGPTSKFCPEEVNLGDVHLVGATVCYVYIVLYHIILF